MKKPMRNNILFLLLIFTACQNNVEQKNIAEEAKKINVEKVLVDSISNENLTNVKRMPEVQMGEAKKKVKKKTKVELELDRRKVEIKNRILRASTYPSEKVLVDSMIIDEQYEQYKKATLEMKCAESDFSYPEIFNQQDIEANAMEAEKIELKAGERMCILSMKFSNNGFCKLLFSKSEGGHSSDAITLQFYPKNKNIIQRLTLTSNSAREGHYTEVNSVFLTNRQIKRVILNYYTSEELENGPYKETTQFFQLNINGSIDFLSENIVQFNFEAYLR